ncbi:uncharacterized protein LOC110641343 [Hevea brasiliensis]|uniref:uncharacterized protein LOC110641343 n=1 Tax=Hevea brasiliensis TaxID=3981 RepID=UPI0025F9A963|nr:uncharacterized protein LOC110641343 [Hevea brasiliensis]
MNKTSLKGSNKPNTTPPQKIRSSPSAFLDAKRNTHNHLEITHIYRFNIIQILSIDFICLIWNKPIQYCTHSSKRLFIVSRKGKPYIDKESLNLFTVLLAASAQNRCTALVRSCYVPSRSFSTKGEENNRSNNAKNQILEEKTDGVMEEVSNNHESQGQEKSNGGSNGRSGGSNGPHIEPPTLKSNLKRTTTVEEINQSRKRKVSWPDAHGNDIAHVHEFEPSLSEDGELEGVRNSCICTIQ